MLRYVKGFFSGFGVTFKHLLQPKETINYPDVKREYSLRFRGKHMLAVDEAGQELCVGCGLCEAVCPAKAIRVVSEENEGQALTWSERYAAIYEVDLIRCIFCGLCEEACPTNAVRLTRFNEMASYDRQSTLVGRDDLMHPVMPKLPHPDYHPEAPGQKEGENSYVD